MILPYFYFPVALRHSHLGLPQTALFNISLCLNNDVFIWWRGITAFPGNGNLKGSAEKGVEAGGKCSRTGGSPGAPLIAPKTKSGCRGGREEVTPRQNYLKIKLGGFGFILKTKPPGCSEIPSQSQPSKPQNHWKTQCLRVGGFTVKYFSVIPRTNEFG